MTALSRQKGALSDAVKIAVLALAPAIGVGIARFAYALVLPDMRASLHWSYAAAGSMNTINAAGYLIGALAAPTIIRRCGEFSTIIGGVIACVVALAVSAVSADFLVLGGARLTAGIAGAVAFVAGGVVAAQISQRQPARAAFLLSLYYIGPGIGILLSGVATPWLLEARGAGSWWIAWAMLALLASVLVVPLSLVRVDRAGNAALRARVSAPLTPMLPLLTSYFFYGAGYIAYMTFMIAWIGEMGGSAGLQSAFWSLIGIGGIVAPWVWSRLIATMPGGRAAAVLNAVTLLSALLPLWQRSTTSLLLSALIFGAAFLPVVTATTAFVRKNYPAAAWPKGIAAMTVAFGAGQTIGPLLTGGITDFGGSLLLGLALSSALLAFAAVLAASQRDFVGMWSAGANQEPLNQL
jgi:predicted MFS family arabinose efflux permease